MMNLTYCDICGSKYKNLDDKPAKEGPCFSRYGVDKGYSIKYICLNCPTCHTESFYLLKGTKRNPEKYTSIVEVTEGEYLGFQPTTVGLCTVGAWSRRAARGIN